MGYPFTEATRIEDLAGIPPEETRRKYGDARNYGEDGDGYEHFKGMSRAVARDGDMNPMRADGISHAEHLRRLAIKLGISDG